MKTEEPLPGKRQENSPERINNETGLCRLIDTNFKKEIMKILKTLREKQKKNDETWTRIWPETLLHPGSD